MFGVLDLLRFVFGCVSLPQAVRGSVGALFSLCSRGRLLSAISSCFVFAVRRRGGLYMWCVYTFCLYNDVG